jgi:hypothetical protein
MKPINSGAPHFSSLAKQHRHANYTLDKVCNEVVDNVIKKASEIYIITKIDDTGRLQELQISDNYVLGFHNIDAEGTSCPLNMGHISESHDCDDETSEFGVGLKAGALNACNVMTVVTKINNQVNPPRFIRAVLDFQRMSNEPDVNNSYNPTMREATIGEYNEVHPFETGSSIIMSQMRDTISSRTDQKQITNDIKRNISNTYSNLLSPNTQIWPGVPGLLIFCTLRVSCLMSSVVSAAKKQELEYKKP